MDRARQGVSVGPDESADDRINILLVDDHPENLVALRAVLGNPDYHLVCAASGAEALRKILKHDFALILLDVFMPLMDGFAVATAIKSREKTQHIPIIFLTAMAKDIQHIYRAYEIGAVDYIHKPLEPNVVKAKVAVFADLHRKNLQIRRQAEQLRESEGRERLHQVTAVKRAAEKKFQDLVEGIDHGIVWSADPETLTFSYVSPRAEPILGYPVTQWMGERGFWANHLYPSERERVLGLFQEARQGKEVSFEHRFFTSDGEIRWFHTGVRLARKGEGDGYEVRGLSVDITSLKETEEALRDAVRMRDEFLSIASHELKTPITPLKLQIQTFTMALEQAAAANVSNAKVGALLRKGNALNQQVDRLSLLIDNLLDASRITAGLLTLQVEKTDLSALVRETAERFAPQLALAKCELTISGERSLEGNWDRFRLEQALVNLVTNAMKYGAGQPIEIHLSTDGDRARVSVRDHGIGIAKEHQERVFSRFERAVGESAFTGLGLGLYITRQIVQAHEGVIEVTSELGKGSTFTMELPFEIPSRAVVAAEQGSVA